MSRSIRKAGSGESRHVQHVKYTSRQARWNLELEADDFADFAAEAAPPEEPESLDPAFFVWDMGDEMVLAGHFQNLHLLDTREDEI